MSGTPSRWLWVAVATLAAAPVLAQTPQWAWNPAISGAVAAFSQDAQAPDPASITTTADGTQGPRGAVHSDATEPQGVEKAEQDNRRMYAVHEKTKKAGAKYDVSQIGGRAIGKGVNFYSLQREQSLGRELASELEQQVRLLDDSVVTEYVNRVGQNLARNSDAKVPFTIKVIDDDEINALALPGGYFYVNSGLILGAENEAELAGVMAHEIAHVAARHATRDMTKGQIWNMASIPLIFVGGAAGYAVRQVAGLAVPMSFLKFSRNAEREADLLGLEYEYAAGYDPLAFVQFFEKVHAQEKRSKHSFVSKMFSTHPMTEDRIKRAQEEIATILPPREQYVVTTSAFDEVRKRLARVTVRLRAGQDQTPRPTLRRRTPKEVGDNGPNADGAEHGEQHPTIERAPN